MRSLIERLVYGGSKALRPYEAACVECLAKALPEDVRVVLMKQLRRVTLFQRFSQDKLVTFNFRGPDSDALPFFVNTAPELTVARVTVRANSDSLLFRCDVVVHRGKLSSLEFDEPPDRKVKKARSFSCEGTQLFGTLIEPEREHEAAGDLTARRIQEILRTDTQIVASQGAASEEGIQSLSARLGPLPDDFVALLRVSDAFRANAWQFHGTRGRRVVRPDGNYWLIAESKERALAFLEGTRPLRLFSYDQIDDSVSPLELNVVSALARTIQEGSA